jgi:hypothetical protein
MKKLNIYIIHFFLFFYLTSSYLSATHIHNEAIEQQSDCKVCILAKNLHGKDIIDTDISCLNCANYYELIQFNQQLITQILLKGFNANAPPILS